MHGKTDVKAMMILMMKCDTVIHIVYRVGGHWILEANNGSSGHSLLVSLNKMVIALAALRAGAKL